MAQGALVSRDPNWKKSQGDTSAYTWRTDDGWYSDEPADNAGDVAAFAASIGDRRRQAQRAAAFADVSSEATRGLTPTDIASGVYQAATSPLQTLKSLLAGHDELRQKGVESWRQGRYGPAIRQFTEYGLPVAAAGTVAALAAPEVGILGALGALGSMGTAALTTSLAGQGAERAVEFLERGQPYKAAGAMLNMGGQAALPAVTNRAVAGGLRAVEKVGNKRIGAVQIPADVAANADYARSGGIPVGAYEQTGNRAILGLEDITGRSLFRMFSEPAARAKQTAAITADIDKIIASISERKLDLYGASEGITKALKDAAARSEKAAKVAYAPAEAAEATASVVKNPKAPFRKAYDRLVADNDAVTLNPNSPDGRALTILSRLMKADDYVPLMTAETLLSDLKGLSGGRIKDAALLYKSTRDQGVAMMAVAQWQKAIDASAKGAGVLDDLRAGRALTRQRYRAIDVIDKVNPENPNVLADRLRAPREGGRSLGARIQQIVPKSTMDDMTRAIFEDITEPARVAERTPGSGATVLQKWNAWGDRNKAAYLTPQHVNDIDNILQFQKRQMERSNPSGSAIVGAQAASLAGLYFNPLATGALQLTQYGLSKFLRSEGGATLLREGIRLSPKSANAANWTRRVIEEAQQSGLAVETGRAGIRIGSEAGKDSGNTPDMSGTPVGVGKRFTAGPFKGQTWAVIDGVVTKVK